MDVVAWLQLGRGIFRDKNYSVSNYIGKTLVRGATFRVAAQLVEAIVLGFFLMPFVIEQLDTYLYGAWVIVGTMMGYYGLLDLGLSSAITRFVSRELGRGDKDRANSYITAGFYVFCLGGIVAFAITAGVATLCGRFIEDPAVADMFRYAVIIAGISLGVTFPTRCFGGILTAHLRYDLISIVTIVFTLLRAGLLVVVLLSGYKIVAMALVGAGLNLTRTTVMILLTRRVHGPVNLKLSTVTRSIVRELFGYAVFSFIAQLTDLLRFRVIPLIISGILGLNFVALYNVPVSLRRRFARLCGAILSTMTPVFSQQEGKNDTTAIKWSYFFIYKMSCYLSVFVAGMLMICGGDFIHRWMLSCLDLYQREIVIQLFYIGVIGMFVATIQIPTVNLLYGTSHNRFYAITNSIQAVLTVALAFVVIRPYGLLGIVLVQAGIYIIIKVFVLPIWACKILEISMMRYHFGHTLPNVLRPAAFLVVAALVGRAYLAPDYGRLAIFGFGAFLLFLPYIFFVGFNKNEREKFLHAARKNR